MAPISSGATAATLIHAGARESQSRTAEGEAGFLSSVATAAGITTFLYKCPNRGGYCRRRRSSLGKDPDLAMRAQVVFEIRCRVAERDMVCLQQRMNLKPRFESQQSPDLLFSQCSSAITLDRNRLHRLTMKVRPLALESSQNIVR